MCIAEALLRIPDDATADRLIAEKLATGDWSSHAGRSESLFVNASTWGLMLTGGILELDPSIKTDTAGWMRMLTRKAGEPLVRLAVRRAMRIIGGEFVVGRTIEEALARSAREAEVGLCSFDMLGEGARTGEDARRYLRSYEHAIEAIGASWRLGTSSGSTARNAGVSKAEPVSSTKISSSKVIGVTSLVTVSRQSTSITASMNTWAMIRSLRRSTMSASAPAGSANRNIGSAVAAPTSDTMIGDGSSTVISQAVPTLAIQAPTFATSVAVHTVRKAGTASGLHADGDALAWCVSATRSLSCLRRSG